MSDIKSLKDRIDSRLNNYLCDMKEGYDDSITGFNEAWDIVRAAFAEVLSNCPAPAGEGDGWLPIDSAPKNGRFLIGGLTITGNTPWHIEIVSYRDSPGRPIFGHDSFAPTHWMPLPPSPGEKP